MSNYILESISFYSFLANTVFPTKFQKFTVSATDEKKTHQLLRIMFYSGIEVCQFFTVWFRPPSAPN
jgi:hypothetical protein